MKIKQLTIFLSSFLFATSTMAASKWSGDWFEIEVILLSQLHDKSKQAEIFDGYSPLPDYARALDLLSGYLSPNFASLKQQLPHCDDASYPASLIDQASQLPDVHKVLSLEEIAALEFTASHANDDDALALLDVTTSTEAVAQEQQTATDSFPAESNLAFAENLADQTVEQTTLTIIDEPAISEQQLALVAEAEQKFTKMPFSFASLYQVPTKPSKPVLCRIDEAEFLQLELEPALYQYNGIVADKTPLTIKGAEDLFSEQPYLVSEDSLKLKDIVKQLRRSKNFRPLLHLAWRQPVYERSQSTPVKLYAGDNFQRHYLNEKAKFQQQQQLAAEQESQLLSALQQATNSEHGALNDTSIQLTLEQQIMQAKQQKLNDIFSQIVQVTEPEAVVEQLNKESPLAIDQILAQQSAMLAAPTPPIQPWYLEGFLDIFLKGVYLNIAADFNVLNMSLTEQASLALRPEANSELQAIRFQQNRRVISKEIHYFDHPYMGMIIQIRRHQRPEPVQNLEIVPQE